VCRRRVPCFCAVERVAQRLVGAARIDAGHLRRVVIEHLLHDDLRMST
jgi:hypothetical protein